MGLSLGAATALGGISALGSISGSLLSGKSADKAVKRQIAWERERATHAHQWEVEDLKAAGLNPILSAGGDGATTGGVSAPVPDMSGMISGISTGLENVLTAYQVAAENAKKGAEIKNINQDTMNKAEENSLIRSQALLNQFKQGLIDKQTVEQELQNEMLKYKAEHKEISYWSEQIERWAKSLGIVIGATGLSAGGIKQMIKKASRIKNNQLLLSGDQAYNPDNFMGY